MNTLKEFETRATRLLAKDTVPEQHVETLCSCASVADLCLGEHGYSITLSSIDLPIERVVFDKPIVNGTYGDLLTGFVAFLENGEFTLECFAYGEDTIPANYRDLEITVFV